MHRLKKLLFVGKRLSIFSAGFVFLLLMQSCSKDDASTDPTPIVTKTPEKFEFDKIYNIEILDDFGTDRGGIVENISASFVNQQDEIILSGSAEKGTFKFFLAKLNLDGIVCKEFFTQTGGHKLKQIEESGDVYIDNQIGFSEQIHDLHLFDASNCTESFFASCMTDMGIYLPKDTFQTFLIQDVLRINDLYYCFIGFALRDFQNIIGGSGMLVYNENAELLHSDTIMDLFVDRAEKTQDGFKLYTSNETGEVHIVHLTDSFKKDPNFANIKTDMLGFGGLGVFSNGSIYNLFPNASNSFFDIRIFDQNGKLSSQTPLFFPPEFDKDDFRYQPVLNKHSEGCIMLAGDRFELFLLLIDHQGNVVRKKNILGLTNLSFDFFISNIFNVFEMSDGSIVILGQTSGNNRSTRLFAYRTQFN